jgi:hypothetical protein
MAFDIQEVIKERLLSGSSVEEAYEQATKAVAQQLSARQRAGDPAHVALRALKLPSDGFEHRVLPPDLLDERRLYMIIGGGGVKDVPSAPCMAEHLSGNSNPSRSEIEAAVAACLGKD